MLIDFHAHVFPDKIAAKTLEILSQKSGGLVPQTAGTYEDTVKKMKEWKVDKAVLLSIATNASQQTNVNNFAIANNTDTTIAFGSVFPHAPNALEEIERIHKAGLKGIKFHPEYQETDIDDKVMYPLYALCSSLGLVMSFHAGKDAGYPNTLRAAPSACKKVSDDFPTAKMVFAHMGGWCLENEVYDVLAGCNAYFDTSFSRDYISKEMAEKIIDKHGCEKMLFGSDCPWASSAYIKEFIDSLNISDDKKDMIFSKNAIDLLKL